MQHAVNGSVRIAWEEEGQGEPLLLVMGHMFGRHMWHWILPALAAEHRVLLFDNRGVGESDAPRGDYRIEDMAEDAIAVLDAAGVESAHVFGVSMGGVVAQELALSHSPRVRSLVLGCTAAFREGRKTHRNAHRIKSMLPAAPLLRVSKSALYGPGIPKDRVALDNTLFAQQRTPSWGLFGQSMATATYSPFERLRDITQPTLVLHGDHDRPVPLERGRELAERIPNAKLVILEGAGHHFIADMPDRAAHEVLLFLKEHS